jgi:hypothetical protein
MPVSRGVSMRHCSKQGCSWSKPLLLLIHTPASAAALYSAESAGNVDASTYTYTPDPMVDLVSWLPG